MARGAKSKEIILQKIMDTFEGSFLNGKELRIPMNEDGDAVEIKVTLTCAKDNIRDSISIESVSEKSTSPIDLRPSEEEKMKVEELIKKYNIS